MEEELNEGQVSGYSRFQGKKGGWLEVNFWLLKGSLSVGGDGKGKETVMNRGMKVIGNF